MQTQEQSTVTTTVVTEGAAAASKAKAPNVVVLDDPIVRGAQTISEITLRRPRSGELRGTTLSALSQFDVVALRKVLPRISSPTLTEHDVDNMDPADLMQCAGVFADFLLSKQQKATIAEAGTDSPTA